MYKYNLSKHIAHWRPLTATANHRYGVVHASKLNSRATCSTGESSTAYPFLPRVSPETESSVSVLGTTDTNPASTEAVKGRTAHDVKRVACVASTN
jgi:hypothetical protein